MKRILAFVASAALVIATTLFSTAGPASACHKNKAHGNQTQSSTQVNVLNAAAVSHETCGK